MGKYPHLNDTSFPNAGNVDVFKYENSFDYAAFDDIQMTIKLISVPWDLGEVHVGLKSIPMGNVVGWNSKEERDAWLDAQEGETYTTKYRSYHNDDVVKLPIPYEYAQYRNYIVVDYSRPTVDGADGEGISRWLYFLRDIKKSSMSTTEATVQVDAWSMFVNDIDFSHMVLERGHYAMAKAAKVDDYLNAPIDNTGYLMTPDVSYGSPSRVKELGFINEQDGDNCYVIACTANPESDAWGSRGADGWKIVPQGNAHYEQQTPAYFCFAIETGAISDFWANVYEQAPQFMATVKCVYLVSKSLVYYEKDFTFCGISCHLLHRDDVSAEFGNLSRELFGYGKYSEITKLYTSPYCHIEVTDGEGTTSEINVEDCASGTLKAYRYLSIAYPYASVKSYLAGVGDKADRSVKYTEITARNFHYSGKWWETVWEHDIPTYAIIERPYKANEYGSWYQYKSSEERQALQLDAELDMTQTKYSVNRDMADDSIGLAKYTTATNNAMNKALVSDSTTTTLTDCEHYEIDLTTGSWGSPVLVHDTVTVSGRGANALLEENSRNNTYLNCIQVGNSNYMTKYTQLAEGEARDKTTSISNIGAITTTANNATASTTTASSTANAGIFSSLTGLAGGGAESTGEAIGMGAGFIGSTVSHMVSNLNANTNASISNVNAQISASMATASAAVITNLEADIAQLTVDKNIDNLVKSSKYSARATGIQKIHNTFIMEKQNANSTALTAASAKATNHNYQMGKAITLGGSYSYYDSDGSGDVNSGSVAQGSSTYYRGKQLQEDTLANQIERSKDASMMTAPIEHGSYTGGSGAVKPRGLWANVVTQPDDAIAQAGIEMLRYGYAWDGNVDFETFNVMPRFSYWKVKDIWASASHLPDAWVDYIRNYLLEGVTVWAKPEYINKVSIYENMEA